MKVLAAVAVGFAVLFAWLGATTSPKAGTKAPDLALVSPAGDKLDRDALVKDGPVVLFFVGTNCGTTAMLYKHYETMYGYLKGAGVRMYAVLDADAKTAEKYQKRQKSSIPALLDPDQKAFTAYGLSSSPATAVLGADGNVVKFDSGCSKSVLTDTVTSALKLVSKTAPTTEFPDAPSSLTHG